MGLEPRWPGFTLWIRTATGLPGPVTNTTFNATGCVLLHCSSWSWCATTACTRRSGWIITWPSLWSGLGGSHALSHIWDARIVQQRWRGGVLTMDCRGYGTPSLRVIPLTSRCGKASPSRGKLKIPWRLTHLLFLTNSYKPSHGRVRSMGRHSPIYMVDIKCLGIITCPGICNGRQGRIFSDRPGRDSKYQGCPVYAVLDSESQWPVTILGDRIPWNTFNCRGNCHQSELRSNSALIFTVTATSEGLLTPLEGCFCLPRTIVIVSHSFLAQYFEPFIVYNFSFPVDIPCSQS